MHIKGGHAIHLWPHRPQSEPQNNQKHPLYRGIFPCTIEKWLNHVRAPLKFYPDPICNIMPSPPHPRKPRHTLVTPQAPVRAPDYPKTPPKISFNERTAYIGYFFKIFPTEFFKIMPGPYTQSMGSPLVQWQHWRFPIKCRKLRLGVLPQDAQSTHPWPPGALSEPKNNLKCHRDKRIFPIMVSDN